MREHHDTVKRLISAIEDPRPPRLLRERTLSRAEAAWDRSPAPDRWSRAWHSRPLRLVWAAAVVLLVPANLALRTGSRVRPQGVPPATTAHERAGLEELQAIVELPRIRLVHAGIDAPEGRTAGMHAPEPRTPHHDTEDKS